MLNAKSYFKDKKIETEIEIEKERKLIFNVELFNLPINKQINYR